MVAPSLLPFDAHNHIQLGPIPSPSLVLPAVAGEELPEENVSHESTAARPPNHKFHVQSLGEYIRKELKGRKLSGMALMATHPREFVTLLDLEQEFRTDSCRSDPQNHNDEDGFEEFTVLPCLGVHPWFLHELDQDEDWAMVPPPPSSAESMEPLVPHWISNLESLLLTHPHLAVGEIGLDNFHFHPTTKELTTPMEDQIQALSMQLKLATKLQRPVSLHCVRAMGKLMDVLDELAEENFQALSACWNEAAKRLDNGEGGEKSFQPPPNRILPPKIYFHAFGGKAATATQLVKTLEKPRRVKLKHTPPGQTKKFASIQPPRVYFGFAPPVNFQSPKTAAVLRAVGLDRLVLETDREDIRLIGSDMEAGIAWISEVLEISPEQLVRATNANAQDLYGFGSSSNSVE